MMPKATLQIPDTTDSELPRTTVVPATSSDLLVTTQLLALTLAAAFVVFFRDFGHIHHYLEAGSGGRAEN